MTYAELEIGATLCTNANRRMLFATEDYPAWLLKHGGELITLAQLVLVYEPVVRAAVRYDGDPGDIMLEREVDRAVAAIPADVRERLAKKEQE